MTCVTLRHVSVWWLLAQSVDVEERWLTSWCDLAKSARYFACSISSYVHLTCSAPRSVLSAERLLVRVYAARFFFVYNLLYVFPGLKL